MPRRRFSTTRAAIRDTIVGTAMGAMLEQSLLQGGLLALLILALGGSKFQAGLGFAINFLAQVMRVVASPWVDVCPRKRFLLLGLGGEALLQCGFLLTIPVVKLFGFPAAVWFVLAVYGVSRLVFQFGTAAWFPLLADIVPASLRGRYFGWLRTTWRSTTTMGLLVTGWWLGQDPDIWRFYPVLIIGIALGVGRIVMIVRVAEVHPEAGKQREPVLKNLRRPVGDASFRRFLIFVVLMAGTNALALPYVVPYLKKDLSFPTSWTMYASMGLGVGAVLSLLPWGRLTDRYGNRLTLVCAIAIRSLAYGCFMLTPAFAQHANMARAGSSGLFTLGHRHVRRGDRLDGAPHARRAAGPSLQLHGAVRHDRGCGRGRRGGVGRRDHRTAAAAPGLARPRWAVDG